MISATIEAPIVKERGDLSHSYRQQFLRHIIGHLERNALEVHDRIYEHFTQLVNTSGPRGQGYAWKHFELWPTGVEDTVSIRQSETIISDGTTGLHCWQAAGALAEWCLANQSRLHGRSVLELGSGTGLTGLVVAKACAPAKVVLTDGNEKVLALLRENVSENCKNDGQEVVRVAALDWEEVDSSLDELEDIRPEVVIAADVVYDGTLFEPLCSAIDVVFRRSGSNGCSLYLACTMRNEETLEAFLRHLGKLVEKYSLILVLYLLTTLDFINYTKN